MAQLTDLLEANRSAVQDLLEAADNAGGVWTDPRAPGKWSPQQLVEHVALVLEAGADTVAGRPTRLPTLPRFVRPIVRGLFFNRVVRTGRFPNAKTNKEMNPSSGPATPAEARARLEAACETFERECYAGAEGGDTITSTAFGEVALDDYVRFMELHTRHHLEQMPHH